ncbi:HlyD family secretion protein, partial [Parabacteroides sp. OttesenSCG-928-G07]|nr:HlyD family secretion protein [Parabacteroides sp. OttesenSCG-928-G07]
MKKRNLIIGIVVVVIIIACIPFFMGGSAAKGLKLETANAGRTTISNVVTATGTVEPVVKVEVGTQVSGIIDQIFVDFNSEVKKGQVIALMDKVNLEAES